MRVAAGITTAPRGTDYLPETLKSLEAGGFSHCRVFDDPDKHGPWPNLKFAIHELLCDEDADAIAVFQDDIRVARGLRKWLDEMPAPPMARPVGVISPYCAKPHQFNRSRWHKLPLQPDDHDEGDVMGCRKVLKILHHRGSLFPASGLSGIDLVRCVRIYSDCRVFACRFATGEYRWFWMYRGVDDSGLGEMKPWNMAYGACAVILPTASAQKILELNHKPDDNRHADINLAQSCEILGLDWWMHTPSLVQHVGQVSTLHEFPINDYRRAAYFCEDAARLPRSVT